MPRRCEEHTVTGLTEILPARAGAAHDRTGASIARKLRFDPAFLPRQRFGRALRVATFREEIPSPVSVSQRFGSFRPVSGQHPPDVSLTPTQKLGGV